MKEHIYTLSISDEHPNSITLPYVFLLHHQLHPFLWLTLYYSENIKIHYSFTREIIIGEHIAADLLLPHSATIHAFLHNQTLFWPINRDFHNWL